MNTMGRYLESQQRDANASRTNRDERCTSCGVPLNRELFTAPNKNYWLALPLCILHRPPAAEMPTIDGIYKATFIHCSHITSEHPRYSCWCWHDKNKEPETSYLMVDKGELYAFGTDECINLNERFEVIVNMELIYKT